jgi:hypothetical protein
MVRDWLRGNLMFLFTAPWEALCSQSWWLVSFR